MYDGGAQPDIPLHFFLENSTALLHFQEFLEQARAKNLIDFYLNAATFEVVSQVKIAEADVCFCDGCHRLMRAADAAACLARGD